MHRSPRSALTAASAVIALVLALVAGAASPAAAATTPTVTGTVTTSTGAQIVSTVTFYPIDGAGLPITTVTSSTGAYSVNVPAGRYQVRYSPQDQLSSFVTRWRGGAFVRSGSTILTVPVSGYSGDSAVLIPDPHVISGSVTVGGGKPGGAIRVEAYRYDSATKRSETVAYRTTFTRDFGTTNDPYWLTGLLPGTYRIVFSTSSPLGGVGSDVYLYTLNAAGPQNELNPSLLVEDIPINRTSGENRFGTAAAISALSWNPVISTARAIFIVNGTTFADALGAGPAAALQAAPILLVKQNSIPAETAAELSRMTSSYGALPIFVIGGAGTISESVLTQLKSFSPTVERVWGADRYATSRAIAYRFWNDISTVFLASGRNFPDALGGGPIAYAQGGPLILVNGTSPRLDAATADFIGDVRTPVTLLGGTGAVSAGIEADLMAMSLPGVRRMAGADRYATGARTVDEYANNYGGLVYLASGANFPDALAGAAQAAIYGSPVLLVKQNCIPASSYDQLVKLRPLSIRLLGGPGVLGPGVASLTRC